VRIFGVDFRGHASGDVFAGGLAHAAATLGLDYDHADVTDPELVAQIDHFAPDWILVVHGRTMARKYAGLLNRYPSAAWLLDEPYETDEVVQWAGRFGRVFLNDPVTIDRHGGPARATALPTCFDPARHYVDPAAAVVYRVGFIGQPWADGRRADLLEALGDRLELLVGEWRRPRLQSRATARSTRPDATAALYRQTAIVVNIFREWRTRDNRRRVAPTDLNPRIYEATACGALVISDDRPALAVRAPSIPVYRSPAELVALVDQYLADPVARQARAAACRAELAGATYAARLATIRATLAGAPAREVA
jgi:hypothetical protein